MMLCMRGRMTASEGSGLTEHPGKQDNMENGGDMKKITEYASFITSYTLKNIYHSTMDILEEYCNLT